jgi:hypothetical protein
MGRRRHQQYGCSRRYVQLVEAYRDDKGLPKQRTVATLGRLDQLGSELESVISGLLRVTGRSLPEVPAAPCVAFESLRALGDVRFPLFFVFQQSVFMLPVFSSPEH